VPATLDVSSFGIYVLKYQFHSNGQRKSNPNLSNDLTDLASQAPHTDITSDIARLVIDRRVYSTVLWMYQFVHQQWETSVCDSDSKTDERACSDKHAIGEP
jgi:hypothetical protein